MTTLAGTNTVLCPILVPPGEGTKQNAPGGDLIVCKVCSAESGGTFQCIEDVVSPGGGPPLHVHDREDEFFYILEGEVTFWLCETGDRTGKCGKPVIAPKGTTVFGPKGTAHCFKNCSASPARMLVMINPGANFEAFFGKIGAPDEAGVLPSPTELIERTIRSAHEFGITILGPNPL